MKHILPALVTLLLIGCNGRFIYYRTVRYDDTKELKRYTGLPISHAPSVALSPGQVDFIYTAAWLGGTKAEGKEFHGDAHNWMPPVAYMRIVTPDYHLAWTPDGINYDSSSQHRVVSYAPLDSIPFFKKDTTETNKFDLQLRVVLDSILHTYVADAHLLSASPDVPANSGQVILAMQDLEGKKFEGSVYDYPVFGNRHSPKSYIGIVTVYNIRSNYLTNSKACNNIRLNLYIADSHTGKLVFIKLYELSTMLFLESPAKSPTLAAFKKSPLFRYYYRELKRMYRRSFQTGDGRAPRQSPDTAGSAQ